MRISIPLRLIMIIVLILHLLITSPVSAARWYSVTTEDFHFIYQERYRHLLPKIIVCAETALHTLKKIFTYTPTEPIYVVIKNTRDTGSGSTTTLPSNRVTIEIAPFDLDYEFTRFDHQFQWLFSHELVHLVMGDQASATERGFRSLFRKVTPVNSEPLTIPFSLLTNYNRYTPTWHQEGIAVFLETWLNGGYGRILGSFDEMFFRTRVLEGTPFPQQAPLDFADDESFLLGNTSYIYGSRFMTWLTLRYDLDSLLDWMRVNDQDTMHFKKKFKYLFGLRLDEVWEAFFEAETAFQKDNLKRIRKYPLTPVKPLCPPMGWVTKGYVDATGRFVLFGSHRPHELSAIKKVDIETDEVTEIHTLPTPKLIGIAATAFDREYGTFFYTTHNNRGYRDLYAVNINTGKNRRIFRNIRLGELAVNPKDHSLWGVAVKNGLSILSVSPFPYREITPLITLDPGTILAHPDIAPDGKSMAATLHKENGAQEIILIDLERLFEEKRLFYVTLSNRGNPEHPAWSQDGAFLYWDAYTTGVANLFRSRPDASELEALSNVETGLFQPTFLDAERLVGFYFTSKGFQPCVIPQKPVEGVAAIRYFGQEVAEKFPELKEWRLTPDVAKMETLSHDLPEKPYHSFSHLKLTTLIPTVNAFQDDTVIGLHSEITDPLLQHRIVGRMGVSVSEEKDFHLESSYEYSDMFTLTFQHSPASFYDLVNQRHVNDPGKSISMEYKKWWIYDEPLTCEQWFSLEWGEGFTETDTDAEESEQESFFTLGTTLKGKNLRKAIGSIDYEQGYEWNLESKYTLVEADTSRNAFLASGDISVLETLFSPHNVLRVQTAAGWSSGDALSEGRFYFGGFANRYLEDEHPARYREVASLPGLSYRKQQAERFIKLGLENTFPPLRIARSLSDHYAGKLDISLFTQFLRAEDEEDVQNYISSGVQVNLHLISFYNVESTLSAGYAHAWDLDGDDFHETFLSLKLFRN